MNNCKSVAIIILNYNGYKDTIECLLSICDIDYPLVNVLLIDNGSTDGSVDKIFEWSHDKFNVNLFDQLDIIRDATEFRDTFKKNDLGTAAKLSIIRNSENIGFAAGCNQGIKLVSSIGFDYFWLLNNDTIVEADSLSTMVQYLDREPTCQVATPQIRLYDEPEKIWNCGGQLKWYGVRKYHFVHRAVSELPDRETIDITFVTGCALLIRSSLVVENRVFTEKYFFGEEDFDFSWRMLKAQVSMVCCLRSIIYHKVGATIDNVSDEQKIGKAYVHYLNRFINLRTHWHHGFWRVWRVLYVIYIYLLLGKQTKCSSAVRRSFIKNLFKDSSRLDGVDKDTFLTIIQSGVTYFREK